MKNVLVFYGLGCALVVNLLGARALWAEEPKGSDGAVDGNFSMVLLPQFKNTLEGPSIDLLPVLFLVPLTERTQLWVNPYAFQITASGEPSEMTNYGVDVSAVYHFPQFSQGRTSEGVFVRGAVGAGKNLERELSGVVYSIGAGFQGGPDWFYVIGLSFATKFSSSSLTGSGFEGFYGNLDLVLGYRLF